MIPVRAAVRGGSRSIPTLPLLWALAILVALPLEAQRSDPTTLVDQRVRLTLRGADATIAGTVQSMDAEALTLRTVPNSDRRLALDQVVRIERSLGERSYVTSGLLWGGGAGLLLGGVAGIALDQALCGIGSCDSNAAGAAILFGGIGLVAGTAVGGLIGWALSGERWEEISVDVDGWRSSVYVAPLDGGLTLGLRLHQPMGSR